MKTFEVLINPANCLLDLSALIDGTKVRGYYGVQQDSKWGIIAR
jgi:hypothetical protein